MKTVTLVLVICSCAFAFPIGEEGDKFEGDLVLTPDQLKAVTEQDLKRPGNQFAAIRTSHWKTNGKTDVIRYYIEPSLTGVAKAMQAIKDAIEEYHTKTCLRFQKMTSKPSGPHLSFFRGGGCYSNVGRVNRSTGQKISLGEGCWYKGTAVHEIGHAIGFFHEQSRPDRDNYVEIVRDNIRSPNLHNFNKYKTDQIDSMGSKYDYQSIMHYGKSYFARRRGSITIRTLDPKYQDVIGQRKGFSKGDVEQINSMYCNGIIPSQPPNTKPPQTNPPQLTTTTTERPTPGQCVNRYSDGFCVKYISYCSSVSFKVNCRKTCGACGAHS